MLPQVFELTCGLFFPFSFHVDCGRSILPAIIIVTIYDQWRMVWGGSTARFQGGAVHGAKSGWLHSSKCRERKRKEEVLMENFLIPLSIFFLDFVFRQTSPNKASPFASFWAIAIFFPLFSSSSSSTKWGFVSYLCPFMSVRFLNYICLFGWHGKEMGWASGFGFFIFVF